MEGYVYVLGVNTLGNNAHKIDDVIVYANRVIVIDKGGVINDDQPEEAFRECEKMLEIGLRPPQTAELMEKLTRPRGH